MTQLHPVHIFYVWQMDEKNTVTSQTSYTVELQERTLYEGFCSLEYGPESSFYTTFYFNLSNDGTQFSPQMFMYTSLLVRRFKTFLERSKFLFWQVQIMNWNFKTYNPFWSIWMLYVFFIEHFNVLGLSLIFDMPLMHFQSGYCYINGTCIHSWTFKSNNSCWQCLASSNAIDWTWGMYDP